MRLFYDKRIGAEVEADSLGDEWKGYVLRVAGGNDKQGFPMKQGVLTNSKLNFFSDSSGLKLILKLLFQLVFVSC